MKKILILQLRPDSIADTEFAAFLHWGQITEADVHRIRMEENGIPATLCASDYAAVIVGGGPSNVSDAESTKSAIQKTFERDLFRILDEVVAGDIPYLGACYGMGILSVHQKACVSKERYGEDVSAVTVRVNAQGEHDPLLAELPTQFRAFVGHKEACQEVPDSATLLASSDTCPVQMYRVKNHIYATQFHPEMDAEEICNRIAVYKHSGYFPPEDAETLIANAQKEKVVTPQAILKRFVDRYYRGQ